MTSFDKIKGFMKKMQELSLRKVGIRWWLMKNLDCQVWVWFLSWKHWSSLSRSGLAWQRLIWQAQESANGTVGRIEKGRETQKVWNQGDKGRETSYLNATLAKGATHRTRWHFHPRRPLTFRQSVREGLGVLPWQTAELMGFSILRMKGFLEMWVKN